ncbi:MAG: hypothetical protein KatS3mg105_2048 [Gemmatales bacterium]|nr:MAG: hypothetical protein KatS3mg105_2048 [Gemmatales bacterium]
MIADWDTNYVFVSDLLEQRHPQIFASLRTVVPLGIIAGTADVWCRDYMPVQVNDKRFCQFVYQPDYLRGWEHLITPAERCRLAFMSDYQQASIILDGGNVVASRSKAILTDKVFWENKEYKERELRIRLADALEADCLFIPWDEQDETGHADGVVRFLSEDRVLMNDYSRVDPEYGHTVSAVLKEAGLEIEMLPMFEDERPRKRDGISSAVGIYVNYLRVGNIVILPAYDRPEDDLALEKVSEVLPNATVHQINCCRLAKEGGVLNCVSWTVKLEQEGLILHANG